MLDIRKLIRRNQIEINSIKKFKFNSKNSKIKITAFRLVELLENNIEALDKSLEHKTN